MAPRHQKKTKKALLRNQPRSRKQHQTRRKPHQTLKVTLPPRKKNDRNGKGLSIRSLSILATLLMCSALAPAQSRHNATGIDVDGAILNVTAARTDGKKLPITIDNISFYENGVEQKVRNFAFDPSPSRIVLLVDNSQTLPTTVDNMKKAVMEFAYEIFDGDQLFTIAYDEKPEIIQEWTDDAKKLQTSLATFRKK